MARELARLKLKIEGDTKGLRSSLKGAEDQAKRTGARMRRAFRRASGAVGRLSRRVFSLRGALIGLASAVALGAAIKRAIDFADNIAKTARAVGLTAESLQILRFAARRSGVSVEQLDKSMIKMIKTVAELKTRISSELDLALKDFNPTLVENVRNSKDQEEVLRLVADAIRDAATATEAAAISTGFFGRAGAVMVQVFRDGKFSSREFERAARSLGIVISNELTRAAEAAADDLGDVADSLKAAAVVAGLQAIPAMRKLAQVFTDPAFQRDLRATIDAFGDFVIFITTHRREVTAALAAIGGAVAGGRLGGQIGAIVGAVGAGTAAFQAFGDTADELSKKIGRVQANLERLRALPPDAGPSFFGGPTVAEEIARGEAALAGLQARLAEVNKERARAQAEAPVPFATTAEIETTIKLAAALGDLDFKAQVLRGDFDELAPGTAEMARQMGIFNTAIGTGKVSVENLSSRVRELNDAMAEVADLRAAVQLIEQTATAEEKRAMMIERINALLPTLIELTGSEARANEIVNRALEQTDASAKKASDAAQKLGITFSSAFEDAVVSGKKLSEVLLGLEQDIIRILLRTAVTEPLAEIFKTAFGSILGGIFSAKGNVIAGGRVVPMQRGGIIGGPVAFPLRGGIGVAGETAPEAILPLKRLPSGDLGVGAVRPGAVNITIVNNTGGEAEVRQRPGPRGGVDIEITLDRAVSRLIRGGGLTMTAIQDTFITAVRPIGR